MTDDSPDPVVCRWCGGSGSTSTALAYIPGPDPFGGHVEAAFRSTACKHCHGTGTYESATDPTVDWMRDE